jgi:hypothetical protein
VPDFPDYEVSDLGRVRSWIAHAGRPLPHLIRPGLSTGGYEQLSMRIPGVEGSRRTVAVHRIVAAVFLGPRPGHARRVHVCHNDGDKRNNAITNLRYDTAKANVADLVAEGRHSSVYEQERTHCPQGHPYTEENTYRYRYAGATTDQRFCRTCKRAQDARRSARKVRTNTD